MTTSRTTPSPRHRARRFRSGKRGAALVEAIPTFGLMLCFLGITLFIFTGYRAKLTEEQKTRTDSLTEASHACEGGGGGDAMPTGASLGGQAAGITDRVSGGGTSGNMMMQSVTKTGAATYQGYASVNIKKVPFQGHVNAWSSVVCRPKPQSWGDFFMGGLSSLRGAVGL